MKIATVERKKIIVDENNEPSYADLVQRDGALHLNASTPRRGVILPTSRQVNARPTVVTPTEKSKTNNQHKTPLPLTFNEARVWLQPLSAQKLAVQWHLPTNMRRNCQEMFGQEDAVFVLRIYQNTPAANGWKITQRTLEFTLDITKRKMLINLENNRGAYTAEIGLRCRHERYIFIARSAEVKTLTETLPTTPDSMVIATIKPRKSALKKPPQLVRQPTETILTPENEIDWELRDLLAEEATSAKYHEFIDEGERVLRPAAKIKPQTPTMRRNVLTARRLLKKPTARLNSSTLLAPTKAQSLIKVLTTNTKKVIVNDKQFALTVIDKVGENKKSPVKKSVKKITPTTNEPQSLIVNGGEKISTAIHDRAEIILRGKVKKAGQRVRVGGLLIEPAADGTFCVACIIRNGKLLVPVANVEATPISDCELVTV